MMERSAGRSPGIVSWPMYAVDPQAVAAVWQDLRTAMREEGLETTPDALSSPTDLTGHWRCPSLLLSQTCGYPFVTGLRGRTRYVCTPRFGVEGCAGAFYRSAVMVRSDDGAADVAALRGCRAAYNSRDSQSGYNAFRALVAPFARGGRFFADAIETGAHRASMQAVRERRADVAAIDVVTLALVRAYAPAEAAGLRVLGFTDAAPGLPLVTGSTSDDATVAALRRACLRAFAADKPGARRLFLDGAAVIPEDSYALISHMEERALRLGYPDLA